MAMQRLHIFLENDAVLPQSFGNLLLALMQTVLHKVQSAYRRRDGTPSGDRVKLSKKKKKKKKVERVIYPWKAEILVISTM